MLGADSAAAFLDSVPVAAEYSFALSETTDGADYSTLSAVQFPLPGVSPELTNDHLPCSSLDTLSFYLTFLWSGAAR